MTIGVWLSFLVWVVRTLRNVTESIAASDVRSVWVRFRETNWISRSFYSELLEKFLRYPNCCFCFEAKLVFDEMKKKETLEDLFLLLLSLLWRWHLCLSDKPVEEGSVGEETVLIFRVSQLLEELLGVLLGDGVSYNFKKMLKSLMKVNMGLYDCLSSYSFLKNSHSAL